MKEYFFNDFICLLLVCFFMFLNFTLFNNNKTNKIKIVDTGTASMAQGLVAMSAARAAKNAKSLDELADMAETTAKKTNVYVAMDTMEFLKRGGRIGKARAMLGSILNIKPIITTDNGEIVPHSRARTIKKAIFAR